ncbi:MAG: SRPBCC family protein [Burkholderiales bacterium]
MIQTTAIIVVVLIAIVLILAANKPDIFHVQRATSIKAPPEKIYALINDFKRWGAWSPWENKDPAMKRNYGATTEGKGAFYSWEGNKDVGLGSMEITETTASSKILLKLDFLKPFEAHNTIEFSFAPQGEVTEVNWSMQGPTPFMGKIMHVFMNMDKMVGKDFETGLANLKAAAEK